MKGRPPDADYRDLIEADTARMALARRSPVRDLIERCEDQERKRQDEHRRAAQRKRRPK